MTCDVELTPTAEDDLDGLDAAVADRVIEKLRWLAENADTVRIEALSGRWRGVCKLRVGDYRVIYTRDLAARRIVVHFVRHRSGVYKADWT
ncbi:MAG: type II toxin-antitoxin system RelE/ParE family toxin [Acidobacteria bacterium]|nr:type II toxin-antitoxin system RelE/ParE family toxin [Acidobacteriota bacterium]